MALSVKHGRLGIDDFDENITVPSRSQKLVRGAISHLAAICLTAVLTGGLSLEERTTAIQDTKDEIQNLAIYAGCADRDQLGNFFWHQMLTTTTARPAARPQPVAKPPRR